MNEVFLKIVIPGWNPHKSVLIPMSIIPVEIKESTLIKTDTRLIAFVNLAAEKNKIYALKILS
jgi:hypothetical protein